MKYKLIRKILEGVAREDLYSSLDEINMRDKYDDSMHLATTPLPFST